MEKTSMLAFGHIILAALDEGDSAIIVLRPDSAGTYRIVETNATYSRITNYAREEALGAALSDLHSLSTDMAMQQSIDDAMRLGKSLRGEIEYASRVGRLFWFGFTLLPIVDPVTRCLYCVLLGRDITEKRKQDSEQSATQAMLASIFQKIDAAAAIVRSDGFILLANPCFQTLLGYSARELPHLTNRQMVAPAFRDMVSTAHTRQFDDGKPYKLDVVAVHKDGTHIPIHLTSIMVQRSDKQCFRVLTLRPVIEAAVEIVAPQKSVAILGSVQFLGLDAIKVAYGPRWAAVGERLILAAEGILRRRLSTEDVLSRTADQGFRIWFKSGTEEENAARVTRIGREIRIMLLGELGEEAQISVSAYAQAVDVADPMASPTAIMASLDRLAPERQLEDERQAREFLEWMKKQQPSEPTYLFDRSGRAMRSSFIDLPRNLRARFAEAMALAGETDVDLDTGLFRIAIAAKTVLEDLSQGCDDIRLVVVPFGLFATSRGREQFGHQWQSYPLSVGQRLVLMLSELPPKIAPPRIAETTQLLKKACKRVGVLLDDIETLSSNWSVVPFNIVGLVSDSVAGTSEANLRSFIQKMHAAKARVLIRLSIAEPPRRWYSLGADFTAAF